MVDSMNVDSNPTAWVERRERRARALAALGDPTRLGAMDLLAVQDLSPDALSAALEVPGNLLAHHLKVLEIAGLVRRVQSKNDRRRTYVHAVEDGMAGLLPEPGFLETSRVLFVCTHNSARSVLAEALWREASDVPSAACASRSVPRSASWTFFAPTTWWCRSATPSTRSSLLRATSGSTGPSPTRLPRAPLWHSTRPLRDYANGSVT